jgi:hypothetical protein
LKGPTVVQKGQRDAIGDGAYPTVYCSARGSPRRPGGQVRRSVPQGQIMKREKSAKNEHDWKSQRMDHILGSTRE